ncbi:MAG: hypothetical protein A4E66_02052 [Syntrophus sp. PtaB.Bin001]|nr:MAG: hypothetical protein A4E66_02052 [Syntrophus sp. PtaB.Bin001]
MRTKISIAFPFLSNLSPIILHYLSAVTRQFHLPLYKLSLQQTNCEIMMQTGELLFAGYQQGLEEVSLP